MRGTLSAEHIHLFQARSEERIPEWKVDRKGRRHKVFRDDPTPAPVYSECGPGLIEVNFGAVLHLARHNKQIRFDFSGAPRFEPVVPDPATFETLWPFQKTATSKLLSSRCGIVELATGAGKTNIECVIAMTMAKYHNVIFLAPTDVTRKNFAERLTAEKYPFRFDPANVYDYRQLRDGGIPDCGQVIIANADTMRSDVEESLIVDLSSVGTLIGDEAHHFTQSSWRTVYSLLPNLQRSYGLSATVFEREDDPAFTSFANVRQEVAHAVSCCGPLLLSLRAIDVEEYIDIPVVYDVPYVWKEDTKRYHHVLDWPKVRKAMEINKDRTAYLVRLMDTLAKADRQVLLPVSKKEYGLELLGLLARDDAACWFGSGKIYMLNSAERCRNGDELKTAVESRRVNVLICTSHLNEGADLPSLDTIILHEGRKARTQIQRAGRVTRKSDGFRSAVVNVCDEGQVALAAQGNSRAKTLCYYYGRPRVIKCASIPALSQALKERG